MNWSLCLLSGPGKWTACGPIQPAIQQPPKLCFISRPNASSCLQPSAAAPSSAQQWTLKPAGGEYWGPSYYQADGRTSAVQRKMDHVALLLPLNMYSNSVFLFLCLGGPVAPASVLTHKECGRLLHIEASLYICTLLLRSSQAKIKSEYSFCGLTQLSAIQLYSFSQVIMKICMYDTKTWSMYVCSREDLNYQQKLVCGKKENFWSKPVNFVSALYLAHKVIGQLLDNRRLIPRSSSEQEYRNSGHTTELYFAQISWERCENQST